MPKAKEKTNVKYTCPLTAFGCAGHWSNLKSTYQIHLKCETHKAAVTKSELANNPAHPNALNPGSDGKNPGLDGKNLVLDGKNPGLDGKNPGLDGTNSGFDGKILDQMLGWYDHLFTFWVMILVSLNYPH